MQAVPAIASIQAFRSKESKAFYAALAQRAGVRCFDLAHTPL